MGRMRDRMKRYDGEKTIIVILSLWVDKYGGSPETGNTIITPTHEGTIKEVHTIDTENDTAIVTFSAYKRAEIKPARKRAHKEHRSQTNRILSQDILESMFSDYLEEKQDQKELINCN